MSNLRKVRGNWSEVIYIDSTSSLLPYSELSMVHAKLIAGKRNHKNLSVMVEEDQHITVPFCVKSTILG